jgi:hypothetical protein
MIRKTSFLLIDYTVAEIVTVASSVKLIETPEEDIEDSMEIVTSNWQSRFPVSIRKKKCYVYQKEGCWSNRHT